MTDRTAADVAWLRTTLLEHQKWCRSKGGRRADLSFRDLSRLTLGKVTLAGAKLSGANLAHEKLQGANPRGADFRAGELCPGPDPAVSKGGGRRCSRCASSARSWREPAWPAPT